MLRYNLNFQPDVSREKINFREKLIFLGSCFSEHISSRLEELHFNIAGQPVGIVFNPISLCKPFHVLQEGKVYTESDLLQHNDTWYSKYHHGVFSANSPEEILKMINMSRDEFDLSVRESRHLFVTFGSAWVYRYKSTGEIVANCHKIPQAFFEKQLLQPAEIVSAWTDVLTYINSVNPGLNIVFTVSPVKHLRDGIVENSLSKSVLVYSVHELCRQFPRAGYFPSYELVNDDLRDYRFYEQDGAHPNALAVGYVFEKFCTAFMDEITMEYIDDMQKYLKLSLHRSSRQEGREYEQFQQHLASSRKDIEKKYGMQLD